MRWSLVDGDKDDGNETCKSIWMQCVYCLGGADVLAGQHQNSFVVTQPMGCLLNYANSLYYACLDAVLSSVCMLKPPKHVSEDE